MAFSTRCSAAGAASLYRSTWKPRFGSHHELLKFLSPPCPRRAASSAAGPNRGKQKASERVKPNETSAEPATHQTLGRQLGLFFTHEASPGTPFFLPNGWRIVSKLLRVVRDLYHRQGYDEVCSPQIYSETLWKRSGHWDNYRSEMFGVEGYRDRDAREAEQAGRPAGTRRSDEISHSCPAHAHEHIPESSPGSDGAGLKPMNCPGHCLMFAHEERSYRDLPIRFAEFSPLHRNEPSGSLAGLTRVRRFHQDDAHVFCTPQQVSFEILTMLSMLRSAYTTFGFPSDALELVLSTRPEQSIGSSEEWSRAEDSLRAALDASGLTWSLNNGDGAFYGPKIDVRLVDSLGRKHQTATIQLDFQLPQRFGLRYKNEEGDDSRPVMIHRAILGSAERFMAILLEAGQGDWPFWISPRQAIVIPVGRNPLIKEYAQRVRQTLALGDELIIPEQVEHDSTPGVHIQDQTAPTASIKQTAAAAAAAAAPDLLRRSGRTLQHFHVEVDSTAERLDKRVRRAETGRVNFLLVVGEKEMLNGTVNVRARRTQASAPEEDSDSSSTAQAGQAGWEQVVKKEMGEWRVDELRRLFCYLDSHHF